MRVLNHMISVKEFEVLSSSVLVSYREIQKSHCYEEVYYSICDILTLPNSIPFVRDRQASIIVDNNPYATI